MRCTQLWIYPLKSGAGIELERCAVEPRGLAHDRRWMIVDAAGRALTAREEPRLVRLAARVDGDGIEIRAPDAEQPPLRVARPPARAARVGVEIFGTRVEAADAGDVAAAWVSSYTRTSARLVHCDARCERPIRGRGAAEGDRVSFADGYPLLLLSEASLAQLRMRVGDAERELADVRRFRPNVVVDGVDAHAEDTWTSLLIGDVRFDVAKPCPRCVLTTVDPRDGTRDARGQPLRALAVYRNSVDGVLFGMNLIPRSSGELERGAPLHILR